MKKIYGYKTTDDESMFAHYSIHGYIFTDSLEEAVKHFGVKHNNGFTCVAEVPSDGDELDREATYLEYDLKISEQRMQSAVENYRQSVQAYNTFQAARREFDI